MRNSYSQNMWSVCQALLAVHSLLHGLESAALPTWLRSEAEEFCRKSFAKNRREGREELFTLNKMRSGGSTCAVEAVRLLRDGGASRVLECMRTEGTLWVLCNFSEKSI